MQNSPNSLKTFEEHSFDVTEATIFLDVDGTLAPDGSMDFSSEVIRKVRELSSQNEVLLCTNKRGSLRWQKLEELFGLTVVTKYHKKPSKRVLREAGSISDERIVIGDKFLTDHLFAHRIDATFIRVKRKLSGRESMGVSLVNFLDDTVWNLLQKLFS